MTSEEMFRVVGLHCSFLTSKERDNESGLDYFGARYFSSAQGRFTSVDPLMASGMAVDPQSWNRYAYGANNPYRYVDDEGLLWRDKSGNLVYLSELQTEFYKYEGENNLFQIGHLTTDDGTPIEVLKNISGKYGSWLFDTDCHGLTFGDGEYWINDTEIENLLVHDYYKTVDELKIKPQVGDVVIYREEGKIVYSMTVTEVDSNGNVTGVSGLGGTQYLSVTVPMNQGWNNPNATATVYHKTKDSRTDSQKNSNNSRVKNFDKFANELQRRFEKEYGKPPKPKDPPKPPKKRRNNNEN